jgi:hypothetical protein
MIHIPAKIPAVELTREEIDILSKIVVDSNLIPILVSYDAGDLPASQPGEAPLTDDDWHLIVAEKLAAAEAYYEAQYEHMVDLILVTIAQNVALTRKREAGIWGWIKGLFIAPA